MPPHAIWRGNSNGNPIYDLAPPPRHQPFARLSPILFVEKFHHGILILGICDLGPVLVRLDMALHIDTVEVADG